MGLTISNVDNSALANKRVVFAELAFDSSYPTGGESLTANALGLLDIDRVFVEPKDGYTFEYDHSASKLKAMVPVNVVAGSGTAATNNFVFKSATGTLEVDGTGTAFQVAAAEVANTTDLAALTGVKVMVIGV